MYYQDYLDAIVRYYEQKKNNNELPSRLLSPTPAKLKDECVLVYQSRFMKKDLKILLDFLQVNEGADVLRLIKNGRDRFKPLDNFLREGTEKPEERHIDLLGWLLDFEPRPFKMGYDYTKDNVDPLPEIQTTGIAEGSESKKGKNSTKPVAGESDSYKQKPKELAPEEPKPNDAKPTPPLLIFIKRAYEWVNERKVNLRIGGVAIFCLIAALYFNNKESGFRNDNPITNGCMIWTGDNYQQIPCDSIVRKGVVVPYDYKRMQSLRRITMPDTLKKKHIQSVWYRKRGNGRIEYYTDGGKDPVDPNANLHQLTEYMFDKYLAREHLPEAIKTE